MSRWRKVWEELRAAFTLSRHREQLDWDFKLGPVYSGPTKFPILVLERKFDFHGMEITAQYWVRSDTLDEFTSSWLDPFTLELNGWYGCTVEHFDHTAFHVIEQRYPQ